MTSAAALVCVLLLAGEQPRYHVGVDAVRVDVLVTDAHGRPVRGLEARDFELRDSGLPQHIDVVAFEDEPVRVLLALDVSGSVAGEPLGHLRRAARSVLDLLGPNDRASVVNFGEQVRLTAPWTNDTRELSGALESSRAQGATALYDAAFAALMLRDRQPGRFLVIVFSDGADTSSWLSARDVVDLARRSDAVIYTVGVRHEERQPVAGYRVDVSSGVQWGVPDASDAQLREPFLAALSAETGGAFVTVESTLRLRATFTSILREFRTRYLLTYSPRGVSPTGWHPIDVTLTAPKGQVTARRGYVR